MKLEYHGLTDVGQVREINEDAFVLLPAADTIVVCDGMGGHAAGEVASGEAVKILQKFFADDPEKYAGQLAFTGQDTLLPGAAQLVRAIRLANRRIYNAAQENVGSRGMGTTLVVFSFFPGLVAIAHVGDSRAYRLRDGRLERLTIDHSLVAELIANNELTEEESRTFAERNVITRALGTRAGVDVDIRVDATKAGDLYLLCSDGLCGFVDDDLIGRILSDAKGNLKTAAENLINAANATGGEDNITVGLARIDDPGKSNSDQVCAAVTIKETAGPAGEMLDIVLADLVEAPLEDKTQTADTQPIECEQPPPAEKKSGGGPRLLLWMALLAVVTAFIYLGGIKLVFPSAEESTPIAAEQLSSSTAEGASVYFESGDKDLLRATVFVDGKAKGPAALFTLDGLPVDSGRRRIRCILTPDTLLDSVIDFTPGAYHFPLYSNAR